MRESGLSCFRISSIDPSEQTQLYAEILPGVLPKVIQHLHHLGGRLIQVVIKLVVVKELACRAFSLIKPVADSSQRSPRRLHVIMQLPILYELAQRAASRFYIAGDPVELLGRRV